jgi:hypothetical protein
MTKTGHILFITLFAIITAVTLAALAYYGYSYYSTSMEERFFNPDHAMLKPSGIYGHGLGIIGSLLIIFGVFSYMIRKRNRSLMRFGILKYWLEFHIFLCTLGPIMILYHTAFKFGGLVAVSFWSMVAVFLSGIIGRFIYIQIPRSIEGRELSLGEVRDMKTNVGDIINLSAELDEESYKVIVDSTKRRIDVIQGNFITRFFKNHREDNKSVKEVKSVLKKNNLPKTQYKQVLNLVKNEISLNKKIERLVIMQNMFKHWHVAHLPFALVMLVIMIIHVAVTVVLGYRWIF